MAANRRDCLVIMRKIDSRPGAKSGENDVRSAPYRRRAGRRPEGPSTDVERKETEGEKQLKVLLDQQLDTKLTLEQQYLRHRKFKPSATYTSITNVVSGELSVEQFQNHASRQAKIEDLKQMGLNEGEIMLKMQHDDGLREQVHSNIRMDPSVLKLQLEEIQSKIDARKEELSRPGVFREAKQLSRHGMELEKSLKPTSYEAQLLRNLVTTNDTLSDGVHPKDPINHLKAIENELLERVKLVQRSKWQTSSTAENRPSDNKRRKFCQPEEGEDVTSKPQDGCAEVTAFPVSKVAVHPSEVHRVTEELLTRADPVIRAYVVPIPKEEIERNRLGIEEIRAIQKFSGHDPGEPSNVLYLKNLSKDVCETDLIAIFNQFQKDATPQLEYRLMKGKMRGQAFVTFPDERVAGKALEVVQGFVWKGKPIVIQFGRQKGPSTKKLSSSDSRQS